MQLSYKSIELALEFTFTISKESRNVSSSVILNLDYPYEGKRLIGLGEAVPCNYYGESINTISSFFDLIISKQILNGLSPFDICKLEDRLSTFDNNAAAKSAIVMAFYDLQGKITGQPVWKLLGLDQNKVPKTSYTIGIADIEEVKHKTCKALKRGYDILKIKLGTKGGIQEDLDILEAVKNIDSSITIRVDANAAWDLEQALEILPRLAELEVEFVEEPLNPNLVTEADYQYLYRSSPLPLMADESCHKLKDIIFCSRFFHLINLKLPKTGGIYEALKMIHAARALGLKIMLGCFTETSLSITAFAHLAPLVDYLDLDGSLLLAEDPFQGVVFCNNKLYLPLSPGLGVKPLN